MRNDQYPRRIFCIGWLVLLALLIVGSVTSDRVLATQHNLDLLAYSSYEFDDKRSVLLYDPSNGMSTPVFGTTGFLNIAFSIKGDIAYSPTINSRASVHIAKALLPNRSPVIIRGNANANEYPLSWSPDGRYLAIASYADVVKLLIYDGNQIIG